jgi:hypothetical protein
MRIRLKNSYLFDSITHCQSRTRLDRYRLTNDHHPPLQTSSDHG